MSKLFKILGWIVGIVLVLFLIAIVALELFFPAERARQEIVQRGTEALGRPLTVGGVDVSIWGGLGIELQDVSIANPPDWPGDDTLLTANSIDVKLKLFPLLSGEYRLDRLIVNDPTISLRKTASGDNNYTFPVTDTAQAIEEVPAEGRSAALAFSLDRLEINNGRLLYVDDSAGMSVALHPLDLTTSLANPRPGVFASEGRLSAGQVVAVTEDTIPPVALALRYKATYDMESKQLMLDDGMLEVNDLNFALGGQLDHSGEFMTARANVQSSEISVRDLFSLLPESQLAMLEGYNIEGDFTLTADLQYNGAEADPLAYSGNAAISDMLLSYEQVSGDLRVRAATIDFKQDNARLNIDEASFDNKPLKGYVYVENFENPVVNAELQGQINLALARPFLPAETNPELAGNAQFNIKAIGPVADVNALDVSGSLNITDGRYNSSALPEPVESFAVDAFFDKRLVRINSLTARMPSGNLSFSGRITDLIPYLMADSTQQSNVKPTVDGTAEGQLNLAMLNPFLPEEGDTDLKGQLIMDLALAGDVTEPSGLRVRGDVAINDGAYRDTTLSENIEHFNTRLTIVPDTIRINEFNARLETSDLSLTGTLSNPFPYLLPLESVDKSRAAKPFLNFAMTSNRFNVDSLFPEVAPGGQGNGGEGIPADTLPPFILPDIDGDGTATFDTVVYMDVEFTNLQGNVRIRDRVINVTDVTGKVYSGDIQGETKVDLTNPDEPVYDGRYNATDIEVNDFARRFTKFGDYLYGQFNLEGTYEAAGWEPDSLLNTLSMNGDARMREGRIVTEGSIYDGLKAIGRIIGETVDSSQALRNAQTAISVEDGRVKFDKLRTDLVGLGELEISGFYAFDGEVQYSGTILLEEELTKKALSSGVLGDVAGFLGGGNSIDRLKLPLVVGGTLDNPSVNIDLNAIKEQAGQNILEGATDKLKGLFEKKKP